MAFKKECLQAVFGQLRQAQRHVAGMKDDWGPVDIMCCGDFNLKRHEAVEAVQNMPDGAPTSLVVVGGRGSPQAPPAQAGSGAAHGCKIK